MHRPRPVPTLFAALLAALALGCGSGSSPTQTATGLPDADRDGVADSQDNCPEAVNAQQFDSDDDGLGNACDNCPYAANPGQGDIDADGTGDACEGGDSDGDGTRDSFDNCPFLANPDQRDGDFDGEGDACDADLDDDGLLNDEDPDRDGDGVANADDEQPDDRFRCRDADADGCDDCSSGVDDPSDDGLDSNGDGTCDAGLSRVRVTVSVDAAAAIWGVETTLAHAPDLELMEAEAAGPYDAGSYGAVVPDMLVSINDQLSDRVIFAATFTELGFDPSFTGPLPVLVVEYLHDGGVPAGADFEVLACELVDASAAVLPGGSCTVSSILVLP